MTAGDLASQERAQSDATNRHTNAARRAREAAREAERAASLDPFAPAAERPEHPENYAYGAVLGSLAAWRVVGGMVPAIDLTVNTEAGPVVVTIDASTLRRMADRAEEI